MDKWRVYYAPNATTMPEGNRTVERTNGLLNTLHAQVYISSCSGLIALGIKWNEMHLMRISVWDVDMQKLTVLMVRLWLDFYTNLW